MLMEDLMDDLLGHILKKLSHHRDRSSCSQVCKQWKRVVAFTRTKLTVFELEHLPMFLQTSPSLTTLVIGLTLTDQDVEFIAVNCPKLLTLNLNFWDILEAPVDDFGDNGLYAIATGMRHLNKLSLNYRHNITDLGVIALTENLKHLSSLSLSDCSSITDRSLEAVSVMTCLTELYFDGSYHITNYGIVCLANGTPAKTLRVLHIYTDEDITDEGVQHLAKMTCLQDLNLSTECNEGITDYSGIAIARISTLRKLNLSGLRSISDTTLFALSHRCHNLVEVNFEGCKQVTGSGLYCLADYESLQVLQLAWSGVSADDAWMLVSKFPSLKRVVLDYVMLENMSTKLKKKLCSRCEVGF